MPHSAVSAGEASRFAALDDPAVRAPFVEFDDGQLARAVFSLPDMHCGSCVRAIERLGVLDPAIVRADADLVRRVVRVTFRPSGILLSGVAQALASIGFAPALEAERARTTMPPARRRLYTKLGVAGFAFGNIMLFSIPRYANGAPLDGGFQRLFDVLNVAFALPVLLYSASEYFESAWRAIRRGAMNLDIPIAIGLAALFGRSLGDIAAGRGEGFLDSFTGLVFFLLIGRLFRQQAFDRIAFDRTFRSFFPLSVRVERGASEPAMVPLEQVRPGERLVLRPGEIVPADATLLDADGLVDYAFLTGEERAVVVRRGEAVRAGGRAGPGGLRVQLTSDVSHSRLAGLWNNAVFSRPKPDPLVDVSARFGGWFTAAAVGLSAAGAVLWWPDVDRSIEVATAVLIIACPCALTLAAPITLGTAMTVLGRCGFYLKNPGVALSLSRIDTIAFDKTGTLTGSGAALLVEPDGLSAEEWRLAQRLSAVSTHPISRAIAQTARTSHTFSASVPAPGAASAPGRGTPPACCSSATVAPCSDVHETPGGGLRGSIDGHHVVVGSSGFVASVLGIVAPDDERTAVAIDGRLRGWIRVSAASRPGIEEAVRRLAGLHHVLLVSGDHERAGRRWRGLFNRQVWFRQCPEDKLALVTGLQDGGRRVLMVGDGLNDAGALGAATVGVAVSDDTACVVPACDAVIRGDQLDRLPAFLSFARRARRVVVLCFGVSIVYNVVGLSLALAGALTPLAAAILMPVSSLTVIGLSIGATRWRAPEVRPA